MASHHYNVLIVGAGVAGASAAYHLSKDDEVSSICIVDSGRVGRGSRIGKQLVNYAQIDDSDRSDIELNKDKHVFPCSRSSGTSVFENKLESTIKMIVNIFPCSSRSYISHHGESGAKSYLRLANKGLEMEKSLALEVLEDPDNQLTCKGSLYVCLERDIEEFKNEFDALCALGAKDIEWWDCDATQKAAGSAFSRGIYFPHDAVIDSSSYAEGLLRTAVSTGKVKLLEEYPAVKSIATRTGNSGEDVMGYATFEDGTVMTADWLVLSTGGLFMDPSLAGIIKPCYSYLVSIPEPPECNSDSFRLESPNSPNFFTWNFTHDWCLTKHHLRCSGEDHYSALKPPKASQRCESLARWTLETLPYLSTDEGESLGGCNYSSRYGIYSETPDNSPIVGTPNPRSRVCYLLGCNAWGQAVLSYAASLVPALLGFGSMNEEDEEDFRVLNIRRFALLDAVIEKS